MLIVASFIVNAGLNFLLGLCVAAGLGPEAYGRFSLAFAAAVTLAMVLFDWLRLSATRFYREQNRAAEPHLRASLDAAYLAGALALAGAAAVLTLTGFDAGLGAWMVAAIALVAIANGVFDYFSALLRARFRNLAYGRLLILKNLLAFTAMVGVAFWRRDPLQVMTVGGAAIGLATLALYGQVADAARPAQARTAQIGVYLRYGAPIIVANLFFQLIILANRSLAAAHWAMPASGNFPWRPMSPCD